MTEQGRGNTEAIRLNVGSTEPSKANVLTFKTCFAIIDRQYKTIVYCGLQKANRDF